MKVLIVDDNADDRKLLRLNLERHGCETVIEARDGQEGLELAKAHRPDLIISDALMPRLDGFEFLHLIKMEEELKAIPFVFHSSVFTGLKDEELASNLGAEAFITKQKEPEEFWGELAAILERLAAGAKKPPPSEPMGEEKEYLRRYSGVVAAKLEEKVRDLEESLARRKEADEELLKLSSAIEQSPVSIVITDAKGNIEFVNPKFTQITGYLPDEVRGCNPRFLKSGRTPPEEYKRLWNTISSGMVWHGEFLNKNKNGDLFWECATISPVKNQQGVITHYIAIKEDITERKNLEEQLRQSQKMEAIGLLAGGLAHDFNNILTAIIGFSEIIRMKLAKDHPMQVKVGHILAASDRAANLIKSLLAFSRKQVMAAKTVDLNEIILHVGTFLKRIIGEDVELRIVPAAEDLCIFADSGQLEQVLMNLSTNARDAMPGGGTLVIETKCVAMDDAFVNAHGYGKAGRYALVTVSDNGSGMDLESKKRIFEPFFTTKEMGKGTGLGLSVVYGIVKQHNGYINVYSEPGLGTTFSIYLPIVEKVEIAEENAVALPPQGGTETILLAEDDELVRTLAVHFLEEAGYTVIVAGNGEEAVTRFSERRDEIQLLLFDLIMPKKNGKDAWEEIRKLCPAIRAIFLSGYTADILDHRGLLEQGMDVIMKPLSPHDLLRRIRTVLDG